METTRRRPIIPSSASATVCERVSELPAGAVAAASARASTSAAAHLRVAIAAIDGLVAARLEGHARLTATVGAGGGIHLAWGAIAVIPSRHGVLARGPALRTTRRRVSQPFAGVKLLLADREYEVTAAVAAPECLIGGQNTYPLSGRAVPLFARTNTAPCAWGTTRYWETL
jgi:hypothetical protein